MEKILIGTITGAFGLKGELKVLSDFEMPDKAFKINNQIYLNEEEHLITNVRFHKNKYLIEHIVTLIGVYYNTKHLFWL